MESFYKSLQPGDFIYARVVVSGPPIQQNRLGLCRILEKKVETLSNLDATKYIFTCKVIQQWFPDYGPIVWFSKRIKIEGFVGIGFPGMWHIYAVDEFEANHEAVRERRLRGEMERKRRRKTAEKILNVFNRG